MFLFSFSEPIPTFLIIKRFLVRKKSRKHKERKERSHVFIYEDKVCRHRYDTDSLGDKSYSELMTETHLDQLQ